MPDPRGVFTFFLTNQCSGFLSDGTYLNLIMPFPLHSAFTLVIPSPEMQDLNLLLLLGADALPVELISTGLLQAY